MRHWVKAALLLTSFLLAATPAAAQDNSPDRADPAVIERELERTEPVRPAPRTTIEAAEPAAVAAPPLPELLVGAIRLQGARRVPPSAYAATYEPYLGRPLAHGDLVQLASDVAAVARRAGFGLATAWVPQQDVVGGVLTLIVDEGRIDAVRASGPAAAAVERTLAVLVGDGPVATAEIERRLAIASDMSGVWAGEARLVRENGRSVLHVRTRFDRFRAYASLDNWGSNSVGPLRARVTADVNGLLLMGDQLSISGVMTPFEPEELQFARLRYAIPLGRGGTELRVGGFIGHTRPGIRNRDLEGHSSELEVEVGRPLIRSRRAGLWLTGRFGLRNSELDEDGDRLRDDRIATAAVGLRGHVGNRVVRWRGHAAVTQGLDLFDATRRGDPFASRDNAGGVFTRFEASLEHERRLGGGFSIELAAEGQLADRPLLSSEEMGLGGRRFIRAFDYREASGDDGAAASAELRFDLSDLPQPLKEAQLFAYADVGRVTNHDDSRGSATLASAGGGIRLGLSQGVDVEAQLGIPLTEGLFSGSPSPRISFSLAARF